MDINTTKPSYWLNWRFLFCALYVFGTLVVALVLIWKYEGKTSSNDEQREDLQVPVGIIYEDEVWRTSLKAIHPAWLLGFRVHAFILLLALLIGNTIADGLHIFFFYTQWTFALTVVFFGLASAFSIHGCWYHSACLEGSPSNDEERGSCAAPQLGGNESISLLKSSCNHEDVHAHQIAGSMVYLFQIIYQVTGGAVILTDVVWWFVLYPFFTAKDFKLSLYDVCLHSANLLVLLDGILNGMRFPMFRIAYFILWTTSFVLCQWIIHACVSLPWPYPFMELSTPFAPLRYAGVGLMHIPCYGFFAVIVKIKYSWLANPFPTPITVSD